MFDTQDFNTYIFGAFGTNNIGDDAILFGAHKKYTNLGDKVHPIYVNKLVWPNALCYDSFLQEDRVHFKAPGRLLIGGGGLLHCQGAVQDYIKLASIAIEDGLSVEIQAIGTEGVSPTCTYVPEVKQLCALASQITVRTKCSQNILRGLGIKSSLTQDFAYQLRPSIPGIKYAKPMFPDGITIGIVTSSTEDYTSYTELQDLIRAYTIGPSPINFLHIPHSRAYVDPRNNDVICGEWLWSSIYIYHADRESHYKQAPYSDTLTTLGIYKSLDALITWRFHGLVFSELVNKPCLLAAPSYKNMSYVQDTNRKDLIVKSTTLDEAFTKLLAIIKN